ncbi:hypothetical protein VM1G_10888 [Cytospora mali]|uniref:Peptidase S8/S53 domain-containing protein n=1 Tax=Cytospora mali TaxID=578113 RepID=A0A194VJD4_CYTMA|nr:hypothetical protein VM1G_10888 [Valsa mali]
MSNKATSGTDDSHLGPFILCQSRDPPEHGWIASDRKALMTLHAAFPSDVKPERIKVALIDDGIDRTSLLTYQNRVEVTGMSYWTPSAGVALQNPSWHQSTHGHGTFMGNSIVRVNPWVFWYVMRIQDEVDNGQRKDGSIRIHAESAARAMEDAITAGVKIISILWTIRDLASQDSKLYPKNERDAIKSLKKAIENAKAAKELLFLTMSFDSAAADAYGYSEKATEDNNTIHSFFPGSQVVDDFNPRLARPVELKHRDGSSVATTLAAGMASSIMYLANVMREHYRKDEKTALKFTEYGERLRQRNAMKKAFDNIITEENYKDIKFFNVWDLFSTRAERLQGDTKNGELKWDTLAELCTKLVA